MRVAWRYLDAEGAEVGSSGPFETREDAEVWLAVGWEDLAADGVGSVMLVDVETDEEVYRMSLEADGRST